MDLKGSLVDTNLRIYPSGIFIDFIQTIKADDVPENYFKFFKSKSVLDSKQTHEKENISADIQLNNQDICNLIKIKEKVKELNKDLNVSKVNKLNPDQNNRVKLEKNNEAKPDKKNKANPDKKSDTESAKNDENVSIINKEDSSKNLLDASGAMSAILPEREGPFLLTKDIIWLHAYLGKKRKADKNVPYLHELLQGSDVDTPRNQVLKRNPVLEARCVKLRAQQDAREYRKMTKSVDNVRLRFPDDSIGYQLKQINRQMIAIGQFIISIFAGFLFGFKGVDWMIGNLDFGFRLLLGVMCALIIALAEIYFLAKKLNEELNVPETTQLGGPPRFADEKQYAFQPRAPNSNITNSTSKEHQD